MGRHQVEPTAHPEDDGDPPAAQDDEQVPRPRGGHLADDDDDEEDDDAAAAAGQPHVIEMIDDGEWNEIFNAQGITPGEIELFKVAMRFLKDELSNMSTVVLSQQHLSDGGGSQGTGSRGRAR